MIFVDQPFGSKSDTISQCIPVPLLFFFSCANDWPIHKEGIKPHQVRDGKIERKMLEDSGWIGVSLPKFDQHRLMQLSCCNMLFFKFKAVSVQSLGFQSHSNGNAGVYHPCPWYAG